MKICTGMLTFPCKILLINYPCKLVNSRVARHLYFVFTKYRIIYGNEMYNYCADGYQSTLQTLKNKLLKRLLSTVISRRLKYQIFMPSVYSVLWTVVEPTDAQRRFAIEVSHLWQSSRHSRLPHRRERYGTEQLHSGRPVWGQNSKPDPSTYNQKRLSVF